MVSYQLWGFFGPFLAGVLEVILGYLWEKGSYDVETDGEKLSLGYAQAFGFIGIGNLEQLLNIVFDLVPKAIANQLVTKKIPYGKTADDLFAKLGIKL